MSTTQFTFDEEPDRIYEAVRDGSGFINIRMAEPGGEFIDVCGFLVTETPPAVKETT